jgi:hypothetical protein
MLIQFVGRCLCSLHREYVTSELQSTKNIQLNTKENETMNNKTIESVKQDARKLLREKGASPQLETNVLVSSIFL